MKSDHVKKLKIGFVHIVKGDMFGLLQIVFVGHVVAAQGNIR